MPKRGAVTLLLGLCASPLPVSAQTLADLCQTVFDFDTGQWAEYQISGPNAGGVNAIRYANIGEETVEGHAYHWFELKMSRGSNNMISQVLVPGRIFQMEDVQAMVMKMDDQPAMKFSGPMLEMARRANKMEGPRFDRECRDAESLDWEQVSVPAGDLRALHVRSSDGSGEFWISSELPFGVVKAVMTEFGEMVLVGHGDGATSSITETPQEIGLPR